MRKWNALTSAGILFLFIAHGVTGAFQLAGLIPGGNRLLKILARGLLTLLVLHTVIGIKLTFDTFRAQKKSGAAYWKENKRFWAVRISGAVIFALILFHVIVFLGSSADAYYRLHLFAMPELLLHLLLVASIALHVIANVKPVLISFGIRSLKELAFDLIIICSVLLFFMGAMFVVYYLRWAAV